MLYTRLYKENKMNEFIWTDLSTYKLKESGAFYEEVLDWQLHNDKNYYIGGKNEKSDIGIYETPEFFKKLNMPHFWMNYIQVENLEKSVRIAEVLGGKIELTNQEFYGGKIALLRDPMGAGFTVYEGNKLNQSTKTISKRELHTSSLQNIMDFYKGLFNWDLKKIRRNEFEIQTNSKVIGRILEIENDVKGKYEYWITEFKVDNIEEVTNRILKNGGILISEESNRKLVTDNFKEAFFYITSN